MGTVLEYATGDNFIMRVFSRLTASPDLRWSNTYEVTAREGGTLDTLESLMGKLVTFHRTLQGSHTEVFRTTMSTWEPDSHPYDPRTFLTNEAAFGVGLRVANNPLPVQVCWHIARDTRVGRPGKIFMRGSILQADIEYDGDVYAFVDNEAMQTLIDGATLSTGLSQYFVGGNATLGFVQIGLPKGESIPWIIGIQTFASKGITPVQMTHRWYDKQQAAQP